MFKPKKALVAAVAVILVLGIAGAVWAATTTTPAGGTAKLTEAQRKEMVDLQKQILEIKKKMIKKQVDFKLLTVAEGKAMEANLDVMAERLDKWDGTGRGFGMGMGMGKGFHRGGGQGFGKGRCGQGGDRGKGWVCPKCGYNTKDNGQVTQ